MAWLHNPDFSLRQLQYAVAVHDSGGFGRAAEACGVSQPSLSAQVAKLEDVLGVQLFERAPKGVRTTRAGEALVAHARELLDQAQGLQQLAATLVDPYAMVLRVGVIPTIAPYLLPHVAERLASRSPGPRVHWLELQTDRCEAELLAGELDAIVIADPPSAGTLDDRTLGWEPFYAVVPCDDPAHEALDPRRLGERDLLLLEDGHCLREHALTQCSAEPAPYRGTSLATVVQMVSAGFGTTVVPQLALQREVQPARVRALPFRGGAVGRTLRLVWRRRTPRGEAIDALGDVLEGALADALAATP